jgi:putative acetyltransferase
MQIVPADFRDPRLLALLRLHLAGMHANSPPGSVYALDLSGLDNAAVTMAAATEGEDLLAMGAIKDLGDGAGEIKSMRTDPRFLRRGAAAAILDHLIGVAGARGYWRVSLETGSGPAFEAAIALYLRRGFQRGDAFADYVASEFNQFFHLDLTA